jgi:hypothetical protein
MPSRSKYYSNHSLSLLLFSFVCATTCSSTIGSIRSSRFTQKTTSSTWALYHKNQEKFYKLTYGGWIKLEFRRRVGTDQSKSQPPMPIDIQKNQFAGTRSRLSAHTVLRSWILSKVELWKRPLEVSCLQQTRSAGRSGSWSVHVECDPKPAMCRRGGSSNW